MLLMIAILLVLIIKQIFYSIYHKLIDCINMEKDAKEGIHQLVGVIRSGPCAKKLLLF